MVSGQAMHMTFGVGWLVAVATSLCLLVAGCEREPRTRAAGPMRIVVSIVPLEGLVRELAPEAEVSVLVPVGVSEHGYELTPGDVSRLRRADVIVGIGLGLEPRLEEVVRELPEGSARVVWFADVLDPQERGEGPAVIEHSGEHASDLEGDHAGHVHADDDGHDHGGVDPHLWLNPVLVHRFVLELGSSIAEVEAGLGDNPRAEMSGPDPAELRESRRERTLERVRELAGRVLEMDAECRAALEPFRGRAIVTHHLSHGRFAERYGLRVAATIRVAESMEPTPGQVNAAVRAIRSQGVPVVFVEPQFDSTTAERIAREAGVRVVVLDPMGTGDWFGLMRETTRVVVEALGAAPAEPEPTEASGAGGER